MKIPKGLKKGDTIGLVGASSATPPEVLPKAVEAVEKLGFKVVVGDSCRERHGYLAGVDELRAKDVNEMFKNPDIDGIFCIRGGYGATKILPLLDYEMIKENPKVFVGYSDVTALHIAFNQRCELVTYHTPMPSTEFVKPEMDDYTWNSFLENITETERASFFLENPSNQRMTTLVPGEVTGPLIGGNLTLVTATLGTPYEIDTRGKLLFLEDIDEYERSIDRMLTQLKLAGKLDDAAGIILGAWTNCGPQNPNHPEQSLRLQTIFEEILVPSNKPILMDVACGHCLPTMSLPLGRTVRLISEKKSNGSHWLMEYLQDRISRLIDEESFDVKVVVKDMDTDNILFEKGIYDVFSSASLIKVPILIAVLDYIEQRDGLLYQELTITKGNCVDFSVITEQGQTKSTLYELLVWMIITSDNTATNVLIDFVGMDNLNRYFKKIGLTETSVNRKMMDFIRMEKGIDNVTTAKDMATLFTHIYRKTLLSETYSDLAINILSRQRIQDSLKRYFLNDVKMAHKTGSLDTVEHDVGIVFHPSKNYLIGVFVTNHSSNERAKQLIGRISKTVYQHLIGNKEGVL